MAIAGWANTSVPVQLSMGGSPRRLRGRPSSTRDPIIEVELPEKYGRNIDFGQAHQETVQEAHTTRHQLIGTYFPQQRMRIRWWPE